MVKIWGMKIYGNFDITLISCWRCLFWRSLTYSSWPWTNWSGKAVEWITIYLLRRTACEYASSRYEAPSTKNILPIYLAKCTAFNSSLAYKNIARHILDNEKEPISKSKTEAMSEKEVERETKIWDRRLSYEKSSKSIKQPVRNDELTHENFKSIPREGCVKGNQKCTFLGSLKNDDDVGRLYFNTNGKMVISSVKVQPYFLTIIIE